MKKYKCSICNEKGHNKTNCLIKNLPEKEIQDYIIHRFKLRQDFEYKILNGSIDLIDNFDIYDKYLKMITDLRLKNKKNRYKMYKVSRNIYHEKNFNFSNIDSNLNIINNLSLQIRTVNGFIIHKRKFLDRYKNRILNNYYMLVIEILEKEHENKIETYDNKLNFWFNLNGDNKHIPDLCINLISSFLYV